MAPATSTVPLGLDKFKWIWVSGEPQANETCILRKAFVAPEGKIPVHADIVSTHIFCQRARGDQRFGAREPPERLYRARRVRKHLCHQGAEYRGPAAALAKIRVTYSDGTATTLVTDSSWRADRDVNPGFGTPSFDDSIWNTAYVFGDYGVAPWNTFDSAIAKTDQVKCEGIPINPRPCKLVCDEPPTAREEPHTTHKEPCIAPRNLSSGSSMN
ncbi:hypothetical protein C8R44DRAFT_874419 [Mycena epipterygia]|nr:hypothetical protein C8R44DRAFT_874419 [Mycena epipterygia]